MPILAYRVEPVGPDRPEVRAWSRGGTLPFPKEREVKRATAMRCEPALALRGLNARPDQILHATLTSPRLEGTDTENVLIYNVQSAGGFASSCSQGLRFERVQAAPSDSPLPGAEHEHRYTLAALHEDFRHWGIDQHLAGFDWATVPSYDDYSPVTSKVWWPIQNATTVSEDLPSQRPVSHSFALKLELRAPIRNTSTRVKKAVDAVIVAFQFDPGVVEPTVLKVLEAQLDVPAVELAESLTGRERAVLGPKRRLIEPWGKTVRFNPDDDRLVAFELLLRPPNESGWQLRGCLFEVEPVTARIDPR
jgi:hypothetical protein